MMQEYECDNSDEHRKEITLDPLQSPVLKRGTQPTPGAGYALCSLGKCSRKTRASRCRHTHTASCTTPGNSG